MTSHTAPAVPVAHETPGITPAGTAGLPQCERCDEVVEERYCTHGRDLCEACLWCCHDCQVEFAESLAYDDDRDEL